MLVSCKQSGFFSDDQGSTGLIYSPISTYLELLDKICILGDSVLYRYFPD